MENPKEFEAPDGWEIIIHVQRRKDANQYVELLGREGIKVSVSDANDGNGFPVMVLIEDANKANEILFEHFEVDDAFLTDATGQN